MTDGIPVPAQKQELAPTFVKERYIHSNIFDRLVRDKDDLVGLVAYGLYQRRKRAWMDALKKERGQLPSEQELKDHSFGYQDDAISALRTEAEGILFRFAEQVIASREEKMKFDALTSRISSELGKLTELVVENGGYRHHIVGHIFGFLCLVGLLALLTFAAKHEPTIGSVFEWLFGR